MRTTLPLSPPINGTWKDLSTIERELNTLHEWLNYWRINVNEEKCVHTKFTLRKGECSPVYLNNLQMSKSNCVKYLYTDKRLTWKDHIRSKKNYLNTKTKRMNWLLENKSQVSLKNKIKLWDRPAIQALK